MPNLTDARDYTVSSIPTTKFSGVLIRWKVRSALHTLVARYVNGRWPVQPIDNLIPKMDAGLILTLSTGALFFSCPVHFSIRQQHGLPTPYFLSTAFSLQHWLCVSHFPSKSDYLERDLYWSLKGSGSFLGSSSLYHTWTHLGSHSSSVVK